MKQGDSRESPYDLKDLTLQESIQEIQLATNLGDVSLAQVLTILPSKKDTTGNENNDEFEVRLVESLPLSITRMEFLEAMDDICGGRKLSNLDKNLLDLLFDVLAGVSPNERSLTNVITVSELSSGLSLLCKHEESTMRIVFLAHGKYSLRSHWADVASESSVTLHLTTAFRLVHQLSTLLREATATSPIKLAQRLALKEMASLSNRAYKGTINGAGVLTYEEFAFICRKALRSGLQIMYSAVADSRNNSNSPRGGNEQSPRSPGSVASTTSSQSELLEVHDALGLPPLYDHDVHGRDFAVEDYNRDCHDRHFTEGSFGVHYKYHGDDDNNNNNNNNNENGDNDNNENGDNNENDDKAIFNLAGSATPRDEDFPSGIHGLHIYGYDSSSSDSSSSSSSGGDSDTEDAQAFSGHSSLANNTDASTGSPENGYNPMEDSLVAASLVEFDGGPIELGKVQALLGLRNIEPEVVFSSLLHYANEEDGSIDLVSYHRLMDSLLGRHYGKLSVLQRSVVDYIVTTIFDTFAKSALEEGQYEDSVAAEQVVQMEHLGWALLPFLGGTPEEKAKIAVSLLSSCVDLDEQEGITADNMCACLTASLGSICSLNNQYLAPLGPYEVSAELTMQAFTNAGKNYLSHDSLDEDQIAAAWDDDNQPQHPRAIEIDEFEHWFGVVMSQFDDEPDDLSRDDSFTTNSGSVSVSVSMSDNNRSDQSELRSSLCSGNSESQSQASMDTQEWQERMHEETLFRRRMRRHGRKSNQKNNQKNLFPILIDDFDIDSMNDTDDSGNLLGAVPPFDDDMDDSVELDSQGGDSASDVPSGSTSQSTDGAGAWMESGYSNNTSIGGRAVSTELRAAQVTLGLDGFPADDLMEVLGDFSREGELTLARWLVALRHIVHLSGGGEPEVFDAQKLGQEIFHAFSDPRTFNLPNTEQSVSYVLFTSGIAGLCSSSVDDKAMVAFTLLDDDSDGKISIEQLEILVLCMLRVSVAASALVAGKVNSTSCSLEKLAELVVREAVGTFGLGEDDGLLDMATVISVCADYAKLANTNV
jgi:hypothetical protein